MRILLVNDYAKPPDVPGGTRHYSQARRLIDRGHDVLIVASSANHNTGTHKRAPHGLFWYGTEDGVPFLWLRGLTYRRSILKRATSMACFAVSILLVLGVLGKGRKFDPDVVIASTPHPVGAVATAVLSRRWGRPLVLEVRDLWPASLAAHSRLPKWLTAFLSLFEGYLVRSAAAVTFLPNRVGEYIRSTYPTARVRLLHAPNGFDSSLVETALTRDVNSPDLVRYVGALGRANRLDVLIHAFSSLRDQGIESRFEVYGDGPERPALERLVSAFELTDQVVFMGAVPKAQVPEVLCSTGALVMVVADQPHLYRYGMSMNKLFDYVASGRPTLVVSSSETPIDQVPDVLVCRSYDSSQVAEALARLIARSRSLGDGRSLPMIDYAYLNFEVGRVVDALEVLLSQVVISTWAVRER
ncbi:glycosyltransferase family 4 protein [Euzebya pacifica]|uniref:glycosyltransferase family 4 protein n=1 Tax=Euzebya pacifica TaxID=1608957 RepID=UPI000DF7CB72